MIQRDNHLNKPVLLVMLWKLAIKTRLTMGFIQGCTRRMYGGGGKPSASSA